MPEVLPDRQKVCKEGSVQVGRIELVCLYNTVSQNYLPFKIRQYVKMASFMPPLLFSHDVHDKRIPEV